MCVNILHFYYKFLHSNNVDIVCCWHGCGQPKYIGNLLKAAEQRKKDLERRIEKTVQKEREAEKGLFDDKEAFVTDTYRRKMEEIRQEEERQRKQEELEGNL